MTNDSLPERTVQVGERAITIRPFRGYKAVNVGRLASEVMRIVPDLLDRMADFTADYEKKHAVHVTREMSLLPQFAGLFERMEMTPERWDSVGGVVTLPQSPSEEVTMAAMFPLVFEAAEPKVMTLLAWIITGNDELREADATDSVPDLIIANEKALMHDADLDQLLDVALMGVEVIREAFAGKGERLRREMGRTIGANGATPESAQPKPTAPSPSHPLAAEVTVEGANGTKPGSSTSSDGTTDGAEPTPSTEPSLAS